MNFKRFYESARELEESIEDKNLLKAVIMAGSPGSGKSFITKKIFPTEKKVNSDEFFEYLLKKRNLSLNVDVDNPDPEQIASRDRAKDLTRTKQTQLVNSLLPIVMDGTGKDFDKIKRQKEFLEKFGYDVSMVFVNTNLETALKRNAKRERSVSDDFVKRTWKQVNDNIGKYQVLFGNDFFIVDNSEGIDLNEKRFNQIYSAVMESPLENPVGKKLIRDLRSRGLKYRDELNEEVSTVYPLYHVSNERFDHFDAKAGAQGIIWFSRTPIHADDLKGASINTSKTVYLYTCSANVEKTAGWEEYDKYMLDEIEQMGYDSIALDDNFVVFDEDSITIRDVEEMEI